MSVRRPLRTLAVLASATPLLLGAEAMTAQAGTTATPSEYAKAARDQTNRERTSRGVKALGSQSCLNTYASRQATAMAKKKKLYHQDLGPILSACQLSRVGENVAVGYPSGQATVKGWMGSSGHRANILNKAYKNQAVAAAKDSSGRWYVAQVFGTPR